MTNYTLNLLYDTYGDPTLFPSLVSLTEIINEMDQRQKKSHKYIASTIQNMHNMYNSISNLEKKPRTYVCNLIKKDILYNIDSSILSDVAKTHLKNYITGYHRLHINTFLKNK